MLQKEFEERAMKVTAEEYSSINAVYEKCDLEKDEFCKLWVRMNYKRVRAYKEARKQAQFEQAKKDTLFNLYWVMRNDGFSCVSDTLSCKEQAILKDAGFEIGTDYRSKYNYEVCYDLGKALNII